ncbi:peptidyl-tRNA hydrolase, PTH2 family [Fistulifera solaris]|uniref:peptidyl-tRNA hydrolase n=1 Tax=Fistulifera solaris TaxID=1519565 RepID=A0A1Z5JDA4_FISSO|nr:peptidyl-tRNA hydrolase, PTH2 family [Fistulifera solaris]|eukprot:GAX11949.1 peptidyl-tRNA hydrolase, PTH2 family [Fistulifera solaris]
MNSNEAAPWMYFLAGALLPTLAWYLKPTVLVVNNNDNNEEDDDENEDDYSDDDPQPTETNTLSATNWTIRHAPYKMVLVVNTELKMGKGKIAAQCGHAAVGCYQRMARQCPIALQAWQQTGCAKIAVQCPTQEELERIRALVRNRGIPYYLVEDAGRTQIAAGSRTVLGVFGPTSVFTGVTDHLKLL